MPVFSYEARNRSGELFAGKIKAESRKDAARQIRAKALWVARLSEETGKTENSSLSRLKSIMERPLSHLEVVLFCRQLSVLLSSGMPIHEALKALQQPDGNTPLQRMIDRLLRTVMQGRALHEAMQELPQVFPVRIISLVRAGEESGSLDIILKRLADFLEKSYEATEKFKSVLLYPVILGVTTLGAFLFMTVFILPTFATLLDNLHAETPWLTRILLTIAAVFQQYNKEILLTVAVVIFFILLLWQQENFRTAVDRLKIRLPFYGNLIQHSEWMMVLGTLSMLVGNGIRIHDAIALLFEVTDNRYLRKVLLEGQETVNRGGSLADYFCRCDVFPVILREMIRAGEKSGELEFMLEKGAAICRVISENETRRLQALAEPAAIFLVGGLVLFLALSVLLPLLDTMTAATGLS